MCSISGILSVSDFRDRGSPLKSAVERMNKALHHRGPDDNGVFEYHSASEQFSLCLGNTRLSIIDPSSNGHQPMTDAATGNCITYNGETYNFRELRRELGDEVGPWSSNTDTEVVLRAYRKWGIDGFGKLRGMFALAIWDAGKRELILTRDPFGIKPLYYFVANGNSGSSEFLFASEIRALFATGFVPRKLSNPGVASYLASGSIQSPETIIAGVRALMPGECLIVKALENRLEFRSVFMRSPDHETSLTLSSRADAVSALRQRLEESVRAHLVSDVPLGVFLSGGMDSSAVLGLMSRVSKEQAKTFTVVFDDKQLSEARHSRCIANRFRSEHHDVLLRDDQLLSLLPKALRSFDQPSMDGINTFVVAKAVSEAGIKVALSGLGGDEVFGGYPSFRRAMRIQTTSHLSRRVLRTVSSAGRVALNGSIRRNKFWQLAASDGSPQEVYRITRQLFAPPTVGELMICPIGSNGDMPQPPSSNDDLINAISELEMKGYMANTLLRDTDTMSMVHSLEVRVPFVDIDVVKYALALPGSWKLNGHPRHLPKPLLADALSDLLPTELMARPKMGFTLPFEKWMRSHLRSEISSVLTNEHQLNGAGLNSNSVESIWNRFLKAPAAVGWSRPWSLYVLAKWCEVNGVAA